MFILSCRCLKIRSASDGAKTSRLPRPFSVAGAAAAAAAAATPGPGVFVPPADTRPGRGASTHGQLPSPSSSHQIIFYFSSFLPSVLSSGRVRHSCCCCRRSGACANFIFVYEEKQGSLIFQVSDPVPTIFRARVLLFRSKARGRSGMEFAWELPPLCKFDGFMPS